MIPSELALFEVESNDRVMDTVKLRETTGGKGPEGLDRIGMLAFPIDVLFGVIDGVVLVPVQLEPCKAAPFVGIDHGHFRLHDGEDDGLERLFVFALDDADVHLLIVALHNAKDTRLVFGPDDLGLGLVLGIRQILFVASQE